MENTVRKPMCRGARRVAFTGYRPQKMPFGFNENDPRCRDFIRRLEDSICVLIFNGYTHFITGGALGMDTYAAEIVLKLKKQYPMITLEVAVPFDAQSDRWADEYRSRYASIIEQADMITVISHPYTRSCMYLRNRYLVDNADLLMACYDGRPGGTAMTVEYANRVGIPVEIILPEKDLCALAAC